MSQFPDRTPRRSLSYLGLVACVIAAALAFPVPSRAAEKPQAMLTASKGSPDAKFGTSVSISENTAVVAAPDEGGTAREGGMGAVYVFTRRGGAWSEQATLVAPVRRDGDKFGFGVAIDRDTIVVGAPNADELSPGPGVAYVFVRRGAAWAHQATLKPSESRRDDAFGFDVAVSGDTALIGARGGNIGVTADPGAAYVFTRSGDVWREEAKLTASDGAAADLFGSSVDVSGDTAVISALYGDVGARIDHGSAYVFTRTGSKWTERAKLVPSDGTPRQGFGDSVAISGDTVVVGAHIDEGGGSLYVFNRTGSAWSAPTRLTAAGTELLGVSSALSGNTVIAGANFTKVGDNDAQGAAYVFRLSPPVAGHDRP